LNPERSSSTLSYSPHFPYPHLTRSLTKPTPKLQKRRKTFVRGAHSCKIIPPSYRHRLTVSVLVFVSTTYLNSLPPVFLSYCLIDMGRYVQSNFQHNIKNRHRRRQSGPDPRSSPRSESIGYVEICPGRVISIPYLSYTALSIDRGNARARDDNGLITSSVSLPSSYASRRPEVRLMIVQITYPERISAGCAAVPLGQRFAEQITPLHLTTYTNIGSI